MRSGGFTLLELVVAIGVSMAIVGGVIANYSSFNNSQSVKQAALTLKNNLRFAQAQALSAKKPLSGCTELVGYAVSFTAKSYTVQAQCTEGVSGDPWTIMLPEQVTFSPVPPTLLFGVLTRGLIGEENVTATLSGWGKFYAISISSGSGEINDGGFP